ASSLLRRATRCSTPITSLRSSATAAPRASARCRRDEARRLAHGFARARPARRLRQDGESEEAAAPRDFTGTDKQSQRRAAGGHCRTRRGAAAETAARHPRFAAARPGALQHLLRALPRPRRRRARNDRRARLPRAALLFHRSPARGTLAAFLRRDHQWLWRDVLLCRSRRAGRSLGDRRLYPRAAGKPARRGRAAFAG